MRLLTSLLFLLAFVAACTAQVPDDASGEQMYLQLCARCHGAELQGRVGPSLGPGSNSASQPDEFLAFAIESGRGRMPSFSSTLDTDQIDRLVSFIREVQEG
jgi:mono/diheme cytochrome c family protein